MAPNPRSLLLGALLLTSSAWAQFNAQAGRSAPLPEEVKVQRRDDQGELQVVTEQRPAKLDGYGNAASSRYDLAVDGAFTGQTVLVLDYYGQSFEGPAQALKQKGFSVVHLRNQAPAPRQLKEMLSKSNQFWLIASCNGAVNLTAEHHQVIKEFFEAGHGVYLWGDNDPCNADADKLASLLIDARVTGNLPGDQTVGRSPKAGQPGVATDHQLTTGLENIYEGVTVATVTPAGAMTPIIWGSAGNLVAAAFQKDGKRLVVDGGFTRLSYKWDSAGTGRYIRNAAAWLANYERFGDKVVASEFRK
ncbi:MAG: hypothetical protein H6Q89_4133 [Myxococcaceae bacterium]|nr:hypothetical protein [Myxococcaceae bacterium]